MRMLAELNQKLSLEIPVSHLVEAPTSRKFAELLTRTKDAPASFLVSMQPKGLLAPVYLIHHLLGDVLIYHSIASQFAPDRPVLGVEAPVDFIDRPQPYSLQALASDYVSE